MKLLVSISCLTYNQERYIKDSIEGFLMQKTTFPFEIIIHDDASTDNTTNIIREYALKYPEIIFPIFQNENQYSKGINPGYEYVIPKCKGKYIAVCEGDDYWTDPYKLQRQVDFLENNPDYGLVHTDVDKYFEKSNSTIKSNFKHYKVKHTEPVSVDDIISYRHPFVTCTICFRREIATQFIKDKNFAHFFIIGDYPIVCEAASRWKIKYFDESTAVRRVLPESTSRSKDYNKLLSFSKSSEEVTKYIISKFNCSQNTARITKINLEKYRMKLYFLFGKTILLKQSIEKLINNQYKLKKNELYYKIASFSKPFHKIMLFLYKLTIIIKKS